jgi:hypothetical protein
MWVSPQIPSRKMSFPNSCHNMSEESINDRIKIINTMSAVTLTEDGPFYSSCLGGISGRTHGYVRDV